jgi:hypothetical protein
MKPIIKVDRVRSVQEALELQDLGVQIICTVIDPIYNFSDDRDISLEISKDIGKSLKKSELCCEINISRQSINFLKEINCKYVQISSHKIIDIKMRQALEGEGIGIIYSEPNISYDSDPSWVMLPFEDEENLNASFYNIDLLADIEDSWNFFFRECPNYPDELLQVKEINEISSHYPILIGLDYSISNIKEIINLIPNAKGINFRIGNKAIFQDVHCIPYSNLVQILLLLKSSSRLS